LFHHVPLQVLPSVRK